MEKLNYEDKINLYNRNSGLSRTALSTKYNISVHGFDILNKMQLLEFY
jgi:hypothetical protein